MGSQAKWRSQTAWYVDPINGRDDYAGSSTAPLKTLSEYHLRTDGCQPSATVTVNISTDLNAGDDIQPHPSTAVNSTDFSRYVSYVGTPRLLFTGSVSSPVTRVGSTNTTGAVTCSGLTSTWTSGDGVTSFLGKSVVSSDGTKHARVVADLGSKTAWITQPLNASTIIPTAQFSNGETVYVYDEVSLGTTVTVGGGATMQYQYCKVSNRWINNGANFTMVDCAGDSVSYSGLTSTVNGLSGLLASGSTLSFGAYTLVSGGYHRLIAASGTMRIGVTPTVIGLQAEGDGVMSALVGGSQGTCDVEFNASTLVPFKCASPDGGAIHVSGYSYGTTGASPSAIQFVGRNSMVTLRRVPTFSGSQVIAFDVAGTTGALSTLASASVSDVNGNKAIGPGGP